MRSYNEVCGRLTAIEQRVKEACNLLRDPNKVANGPEEWLRRCAVADVLDPPEMVTIPKAEYDKLKGLEKRQAGFMRVVSTPIRCGASFLASQCTCWDAMPEFPCPIHESLWRPDQTRMPP